MMYHKSSNNNRRVKKEKLLIVVDMQNDFVTGSLANSEAQAIIPKIKDKIEQYKRNGDEVIFTRDTHNAHYLSTQEGQRLPVPHCIYGTPGWCIVDELNYPEYRHIDKPNFGYVPTDRWDTYLDDIDEIEIVGTCTDICVVSNALILKASYPEIPIIVDASCCAGVTPESHKAALTTMKMCQIEVREEQNI